MAPPQGLSASRHAPFHVALWSHPVNSVKFFREHQQESAYCRNVAYIVVVVVVVDDVVPINWHGRPLL